MKCTPEVTAEFLFLVFTSRFEYEMGSPYRMEFHDFRRIAGFNDDELSDGYPEKVESSLNRKNLTMKIYSNEFDSFLMIQRLDHAHGIRTIPRKLLLQVITDAESGITEPNMFNPSNCRIANINYDFID